MLRRHILFIGGYYIADLPNCRKAIHYSPTLSLHVAKFSMCDLHAPATSINLAEFLFVLSIMCYYFRNLLLHRKFIYQSYFPYAFRLKYSFFPFLELNFEGEGLSAGSSPYQLWFSWFIPIVFSFREFSTVSLLPFGSYVCRYFGFYKFLYWFQ